MDSESIKVWLQAINMLGTFALGVWLYLEKRSDKTNERVTELATSVEDINKDVIKIKSVCEKCSLDEVIARVGHIETDISGLQAGAESAPDHSDIARVYESINKLAATVNQLVGENRGQSDTLRMILNKITERGMQ